MAVEKRCCVPNCSKNQSDNVILHIFPNPSKQADRFRSWVYAIGGDILAMKDDNIFKYRRVCHLHFESKYYTWSKRLAPNAVPTLHLPGCHINVGFDHHQPSTSTAMPSISLAPNEASKKTRLCKVFSSEANSLVRKIKKLQADKDHFALKLKKALKLSENPIFQKAISKFTSAALILTLLQFREINKNKMGKRYSKKEKVLSLALYKQGPRAYRWLRNVFVLPSSATLSRMIARAALKPGMNDNLFDVLSKKVKKMSETDKLCILLFDEIAISPHFEYNRKRDIIKGFVNNGKKNIMKIADHALW
ncbi:unnamed protein product [Parnassius mnemosyne]|uniref:THAP-type domain-containing protein n=1 Tax=Parnassius mnemosyne TaxID=213953 RepID=A0AAV1KYP1_9NEOP